MKLSLYPIAIIVIVCLSSCINKQKTEESLLVEMEKLGILTSCGSIRTGCNGNCPSGQYCKEFRYGACYCIKDSDGINLTNVKDIDSPCLKCLENAQLAHVQCLVLAGNDDKKKKACDAAANEAIKKCPCQ